MYACAKKVMFVNCHVPRQAHTYGARYYVHLRFGRLKPGIYYQFLSGYRSGNATGLNMMVVFFLVFFRPEMWSRQIERENVILVSLDSY